MNIFIKWIVTICCLPAFILGAIFALSHLAFQMGGEMAIEWLEEEI